MELKRSLQPCRTVLAIYFVFTIVFVLAKPVFMAYNATESIALSDYCDVLLHGLPLDFSTAGYLSAPILLFSLLRVWIPLENRVQINVTSAYFVVVAFLLSCILLVDCVLYGFWGFKIDATIFNYLDDPKGAVASVSPWLVVSGCIAILLFAFVFFILLYNTYKRISCLKENKNNLWLRLRQTLFLILLGGVLFLFIRGGVGKSTMNIGAVYYSDSQFLNHSAVNPAFSLMSSALKAQRFDKQHQFFSEGELERYQAELKSDDMVSDSTSLLKTSRPNVLIILMEGFCSSFIEPLGGKKGVTPCFNQLASEGVLFTRCYANSYRTDRGTVSALSGYPAFPQLSVMKLPQKSRTLPSLAHSLSAEGYRTHFIYGGDINFTNMNSYLLSTGYQTAWGETHFPASIRKTHAWGVTDHIAFDTLYNYLTQYRAAEPLFCTFLTLASHEPWIVPYDRIQGDERANSMAYLDDAFGRFVDRLRKQPVWENLLIVCIADHGIGYPEEMGEDNPRRSCIPMLWLGGALKQPARIDCICNQSDLPATLLGNMNVAYDEFGFSRDVTSKDYDYPYAVHTFSNGFAYIDTTGCTIYDLTSSRNLYNINVADSSFTGGDERRVNLGKAYLQIAIDDLARR